MNLPTGERTFFHARGANAEFSPDDIDLSSLSARMLHIGYILLLDSFDNADFEYGAVMARFLHDVKEATGFVNATGVDALAVAIGTAHIRQSRGLILKDLKKYTRQYPLRSYCTAVRGFRTMISAIPCARVFQR